MTLPRHTAGQPSEPDYPSIIVIDPDQNLIGIYFQDDWRILRASESADFPNHGKFTVKSVNVGTAKVSVTLPGKRTEHEINVPMQSFVWIIDGRQHLEPVAHHPYRVMVNTSRVARNAQADVDKLTAVATSPQPAPKKVVPKKAR